MYYIATKKPSLEKFILISFFLHLLFLVLQMMIPSKVPVVYKPEPVKVKFLENKEPVFEKERQTIIDTPEPKKIEKSDKAPFLASYDSRAHSNLKKTLEKKYQRSKTIVPKTRPSPPVPAKPVEKRKQHVTQKPRTLIAKKEIPLPHLESRIQIPVGQIKKDPAAAAKPSEKNPSLALWDGFDPEKYAALDTNDGSEDFFDDEPISLNTQKSEYISYFTRIKHQIERVWVYPTAAATRGINGKLTLRFQISKDGNLMGVRLTDKSGSDILDLAAIKAVKGAAPYYPFPEHIKREKLSILATFIYSPSYGSADRR